MTRNVEMLSNLYESVKYEVTLGTDSDVSVMGKEILNILTNKGEKKFVPDVYYVPGLKCNLVRI